MIAKNSTRNSLVGLTVVLALSGPWSPHAGAQTAPRLDPRSSASSAVISSHPRSSASSAVISGASRPPAVADPMAGFDAYVAKAVKEWEVPGLAIAVVKDDSVTFIHGYGVRTLGANDPVDEHTTFAIGSTTKAFTSYEVMLLADSGKLSLESRVADRYPAFQIQPAFASQELTVRDLLTHRSGIPSTDYLWYDTRLDFDQMAVKMRLAKPSYSFRTHFQYQNVTYALAGYIAARAAGTDWETLTRTRILDPLGMRETFTATDAAEAHGDIASAHFRVDDTIRVIQRYHTDNIAPAGSIYSSVADMSRWMRFLLDSARLAGKRTIPAPLFEELWRVQMPVGADEFYPTARLTHPHYTAYGLGWFLEDYRGEQVVFHTGSIDGMVAIVGLIPDRKLGVVVLANLDHAEVRHALMYTVFDRYLGGGTHDWSAEMNQMYSGFRRQRAQAEAEVVRKRVAGTRPSLPLAQYAGTYADPLYGSITVKLVNGKLAVTDELDAGALDHWNYDTFVFVHAKRWLGKDLVTFTLGPDGRVTGLTPGEGIVYARQP